MSTHRLIAGSVVFARYKPLSTGPFPWQLAQKDRGRADLGAFRWSCVCVVYAEVMRVRVLTVI